MKNERCILCGKESKVELKVYIDNEKLELIHFCSADCLLIWLMQKSMDNVKETINMEFMNLDEFKEKGYLQEVNRRFFHKLGKALTLFYCNNQSIFLHVIDLKDDDVGFIYDIKNSNQERKNRFLKNKDFIDKEIEKRSEKRICLLGDIEEPIL